MLFYKEERMALFIDGAYLYTATRELGFGVDYKRLFEVFAGRGRLVRAFHYSVVTENEEKPSIRPLVDWLAYNGYTTVTKPVKDFTYSFDRCEIGIELAVDVMAIADYVDHVIIFSGDGAFRRLAETVQRKGIRVSVVGTMRSSPSMMADELRRQADNFIDLHDLKPHISVASGDDQNEKQPSTTKSTSHKQDSVP
jgi:uncharacterized LabA/DUF88 family protein